MFTGIVRERGRVASFDGGRLVLETSVQAAVGDSIAVDGVCLTVVAGDDTTLAFDVVPETLARSTLGALQAGALVNVELPLRLGDELGGHMVQGHVDGVGRVRSSEPEGDGRRIWIDVPPEIAALCVEKGSVTVSGVSLTVASVEEGAFAVVLVPHTLAVTTLGGLSVGDRVNVEADMIGKYVRSMTR
jgi:riboflavin synthase